MAFTITSSLPCSYDTGGRDRIELVSGDNVVADKTLESLTGSRVFQQHLKNGVLTISEAKEGLLPTPSKTKKGKTKKPRTES